MARTTGARDLRTRKTRTSKFVGNTFSGWTVVHMGIARVQGAGEYRGHRNYYYLVERTTSDGKCVKQVRLNSNYMRLLSLGQFDIEAYADKHAKSKKSTNKTNYSFN